MHSHRRKSFCARVALALVLTAVMAFFALRTSPYLQYIPWLPRSIGVWADHNGIVRNAAAFFVFALVVYFLLGRGGWQVAVLCLFATGVEVAQLWVRGRVFDAQDIWASVAGILLAWPIAWALRSRSVPR
jgi:glycopeptide antibiotics resistance protein